MNVKQMLFSGQMMQFIAPDSFKHENETRKFMLVTEDNYNFSLMYANNKCGCKDGWIKFKDIVQSPVTRKQIVTKLKAFYKEGFQEKKFRLLHKSRGKK